MPWSNNAGSGGPWGGKPGDNGGGGGQSPWGRRPSTGGGQPPDFEELIRRSQDRFKAFLPGGMGSIRAIFLMAILAILGWMAMGFYTVGPEQLGVELIFGKRAEQTGPGLHWNFPSPVGQVLRPPVGRVNRVEVGFRSTPGQVGIQENLRAVTSESLMLTGDENIIDAQFSVLWRISDADNFLFNIRNGEQTVKDAAESAMREAIGKTDFESARTSGRTKLGDDARNLLQKILDTYQSGITIVELSIQSVDPPKQVIDAFRDVQAARADKERTINEALAYRNEVVQRAEGQAERIKQEGEAYKSEKVAQATGDAQRFIAVYDQFRLAPEITRRRLYLETMEEVLGSIDKILIDPHAGQGVVPYLPLDELQRPRSQKPPSSSSLQQNQSQIPGVSQ
ncbi:MAG: FtsH protease activity modulator HflK [Alphaproteobacteria bacterium]